MELEEGLKVLDSLNLPKDQYAITSSGAMAAHGIREARDLDVVVMPQLWEELAKKYPVTTEPIEKIDIGPIEFLGKGSMYHDPKIATVEEMIKTADTIYDHRFVKLDLIRQFKQQMARDKDLKDIELIDKYSAKQS